MSNVNTTDKLSLVILKPDTPFATWAMALKGALSKQKLLGYVFHDIPGMRPKTKPSRPLYADETTTDKWENDVEDWLHNDFLALAIIIERLDAPLQPQQSWPYPWGLAQPSRMASAAAVTLYALPFQFIPFLQGSVMSAAGRAAGCLSP